MSGMLAARASGSYYTRMTVGSNGGFILGFDTSPSFGSVSPNVIKGATIQEMWWAADSDLFRLSLSGFSSDPGIGFVRSFRSVTGGIVVDLSGASYSYSSGTATWSISSGGSPIGSNGTTNTVEIR